MIRTLLYLTALCLFWTNPVYAGYMIADISAQTLIKGVDFVGREISISGVSDDNTNIIAVITGPKQDYRLWHKKKKAGIWSKHDPHYLRSIPSYFFVANSSNIKFIPGSLITSLGLALQTPFLPYIKDGDKECHAGLITTKQKANLYQTSIGDIESIGKQIFRFKAYIPSTASMGKYNVDIYKIDGDVIKDKTHLEFNIDNTGFDQAITIFSHDNPLKYGILAIVTALIIGSLVGFLFRKDK